MEDGDDDDEDQEADDEEDILDAVSPIHLESSTAIFELQELTYLRCEYTFSYRNVFFYTHCILHDNILRAYLAC